VAGQQASPQKTGRGLRSWLPSIFSPQREARSEERRRAARPQARLDLHDPALGFGWGNDDGSAPASAPAGGGARAAGAAGDWAALLATKSTFFQRNVALLRQRLLRSNQVCQEQSELDQRRTMDMERTTALARRLMNATRTCAPQQVAVLDNRGRKPRHLVFHPHAPLLLVADETSAISLWHYGDQMTGCTNSFLNRNPPNSRVTGLELVHEGDPHLGLILVASNDGMVRGWRGFGERGYETIVSGWQAMPELQMNLSQAPMSGGMVMHLQQKPARLLVGGSSSPLLRLWDISTETCLRITSSGSAQGDGAGITCVTSVRSAASGAASGDDGSSSTLIVGCRDGWLQLHDARAASQVRPFPWQKSPVSMITAPYLYAKRAVFVRHKSSKPYTLHPTLYTLHPTLKTLNPKPLNHNSRTRNPKHETLNTTRLPNTHTHTWKPGAIALAQGGVFLHRQRRSSVYCVWRLCVCVCVWLAGWLAGWLVWYGMVMSMIRQRHY